MLVSAGGYDIALDGRDSSSNVSFVSHAHGDHTSGVKNGSTLLTSEITLDFLQARGKHDLKLLEEPDCVDLLDSGHVLGSKQLFVKNDLYDYTITYSGDYQMQSSSLAEKIEVRNTDVLILDSTYPYPKMKFGERSETIDAIQYYAKTKLERGCVLFQARPLGRTQELIKIFNEIGIEPVVDPASEPINEVYKKHNVNLRYSLWGGEEAKGNFVGIFNNGRGDQAREGAVLAGKRVFTAVATGLSNMFKFDVDVQFALSDHADFVQAREYIDACNPKLVFTRGPNAGVFARNLSLLGYNAKPASESAAISELISNI